MTTVFADFSASFPLYDAAITQEQSVPTTGPASEDAFYSLPATTDSNASPGTILKLEACTDVSNYNIPPGCSLSRLIYQSETFGGRLVPASAYILWPYISRTTNGKTPLVVWAHGATGMFANAAPSSYRNLANHFTAPYPLALNGYAVLGLDYAGLGVGKDANGEEILHEFLCHPSNANDVVYAVQAATTAFEELSSNFVVIGHSQGGGVAWGVAERCATKPAEGYLGAVVIAPVTNLLEMEVSGNPLVSCIAAYLAESVKRYYPDFDHQDIFTPEGLERLEAYKKTKGGALVAISMWIGEDIQLLREGWQSNPYVREFVERTHVGGKAVGGPMLVIQGEVDTNMPAKGVREAVERTRAANTNTDLSYLELPGMGHEQALYASQWIFMDWIARRFDTINGTSPGGVDVATMKPCKSTKQLKTDIDWYVARVNGPFDAA